MRRPSQHQQLLLLALVLVHLLPSSSGTGQSSGYYTDQDEGLTVLGPASPSVVRSFLRKIEATPAPSAAPTSIPTTARPTAVPMPVPTPAPTDVPTPTPSQSPTRVPTPSPTVVPTPEPTWHQTWTVYFTDGTPSESYVWYIGERDREATVLVDTTGFATGITVAENGTAIYFGDEQGSLWSVTPTGAGLTQLATANACTA